VVHPGWIILAISGVKFARSRIQNEPGELTLRFTAVNQHLGALEAKLDERILVDVRAGIRLLSDALNSNDAGARREQLLLARNRFAGLAALDPDGTTSGESLSASNRYLNCIGYWGNYHYFVLSDDYKMALSQAYECGRLDPMVALGIFDDEIFGLRAEFDKLMKRRSSIPFTDVESFDQFVAHARAEFEKHQQSQTYRTLGGYALGLIAGVAAMPFTFIGSGVVFVAVSQAVANSGDRPPEFRFSEEQIPTIRAKIAAYEKAERALITKTRNLSSERLAELQKVTPRRMKELVAAATIH
jgi:hypothetical protein